MRARSVLRVLFLAFVASSMAEEKSRVVSRIAFGSCAKQDSPQPIWNAISQFDPQLFIWLGDNIYGDNKRPLRVFGKERTIGPWKNMPLFFPASEKDLREKYRLQKSIPGYSNLRRRTQVIGTWDDHDYGLNDAGKEFNGKNISQKLMLDFLDEAPDSPRFNQAGVYASYTFGPLGKQIKVILLDTRYHRDPIGSDGTILGETQWAWLEEELHGPPTEITIIGSSIQVISNLSACTGPLFYMECWGRFPRERRKLFNLIEKTKRSGVIFISGDVHFAEITRYDCATGYPLYDMTSSGITQGIEKVFPSLVFKFTALVTPSTMRVYNSECQYKSCTYGKPNFGTIEVNWGADPPTLKLETRDSNGAPVMGLNISLLDLQIKEKSKSKSNLTRHHVLEVDLPWFLRHRLAILVFSILAVSIVLLILAVCMMALCLSRCRRKFKVD